MNTVFGDDFSSVRAFSGRATEMASMGASAAAGDETVVFADENPSKEEVAHELTHIYQNRMHGSQGIAANSSVSTPSSNAEVEARMVGQRVATGQGAGPIQAAPGGDIQRNDNAIEVVLIEVDTSRSAGTIAEDNVNTVHAILLNYQAALQNFETVVNNSSASEAAPRDEGMIALETLGAFIQGKIVSGITGLVPGGSVANDIIGLGQGILSAIQSERDRSARSGESNTLMLFITQLRTQIGTSLSVLLTNKVEARDGAQAYHDGLDSDGARDGYRLSLALRNTRLTQSVSGDCGIGSLFTRIATGWIKSTQRSGGHEARVVIKLNRDWEVISAYIDAPRGDRLAEQILAVNGGRMNLWEWDVPRYIEWLCLYPPERLAWVTAEYNARGQGSNVGSNMLGARHVGQFVQNLRDHQIPDTVMLTGRQTS